MRLILLLSAILFPAALVGRDPLPIYNFQVEIDGTDAGSFQNVDEISCEIEVIEYQDGSDQILRKRPGRVKYGNITLKRGYTASNDLFNWWQQLANGEEIRETVTLSLLDQAGETAISFEFQRCWPFKWTLSGFDNSGLTPMSEEVSLVTEGFAPTN